MVKVIVCRQHKNVENSIVRYLLLVLLLISNVATADCFVVTNLMTKWQLELDELGVSFGKFKDKEFHITITEDMALVSPGGLNCIRIGKALLECGEDLKLVRLSESEVEYLKSTGEIGPDANPKKFAYTVTEGTVKQIWHLIVKTNEVFLTIPEKNKMYRGVIKGRC